MSVMLVGAYRSATFGQHPVTLVFVVDNVAAEHGTRVGLEAITTNASSRQTRGFDPNVRSNSRTRLASMLRRKRSYSSTRRRPSLVSDEPPPPGPPAALSTSLTPRVS